MVEFEVLVDGGPGGLEVVVNYLPGRGIVGDEKTNRWIEEVWQESLARSRAEGVPLYDGKLFRLEGVGIVGAKLLLDLGDTGYREYVGTRQPEFYRHHPRERLANPLAVCAALVTSDSRILVERRKGLDVYPGRYHVIGGFFERDKDGKVAPHPARAIRREVQEETGLNLDRKDFTCLGLVYDLAVPHPELCFTARAGVTFDEVSPVEGRPGTDGEVIRLESVEDSAEGLRDFVLRNHGNISATGEPCLLLYGESRFGRDWYDDLMGEIR